jgi:hypothetical protein
MTILELKEWVNKLPEDLLELPLVIRELREVEGEGKFGQKDAPVVSAMVDKQSNRLCLFDFESQKVIQKIRENAPKPEDKIEGSTPTAE